MRIILMKIEKKPKSLVVRIGSKLSVLVASVTMKRFAAVAG